MQFDHGEWLKKSWIIQEVISASDNQVVCGKLAILWLDLSIAAEILDCSRDIRHSTVSAGCFEPTTGPRIGRRMLPD